MTTPPEGPPGQDPYGPNPYGQNPYWGGQPPDGPYPYPPPGGAYPNPPGGYPPPQQYPGQQYPPPGQPYPPPGPQYPPPGQPYPQPGQPYPPPGWPGGPYPPGPPPPPGPRSKLPWLILAGVAVLGVIALAAILIIGSGNRSNRAPASRPTTSAQPSQPTGEQNATGCTPNVSGGDKPTGDTISAGKLSFPAGAAPGWAAFSDDQSPNLIGAVGVGQDVPGANQWMMQAEVAVTNFVTGMDVSAQASKLMECVANGPGYANASPTLGPMKTSSLTVDGVKAARVDADITIADPARNVKGDSVTIIAVDTKPVTVFLGATPIGDAASAATLGHVIAALKVRK